MDIPVGYIFSSVTWIIMVRPIVSVSTHDSIGLKPKREIFIIPIKGLNKTAGFIYRGTKQACSLCLNLLIPRTIFSLQANTVIYPCGVTLDSQLQYHQSNT